MNYDEQIKEAIGEKSNCITVPEKQLDSLKIRFPEKFISLWKKDGWCNYGNGKFWTVNPDLVTPLLPKIDLIPKGFSVFARDAFANIFLLSGIEIYRLDVHNNILNNISVETDFFFYFELSSKTFTSRFLEEKKFKAARKKLGDLEAGECYSYKLALALGGEDDVDNMKKSNFLEQLSILLQLNE